MSNEAATTATFGRPGSGGLLLAAAPLALAIGVFSVVYGAAATLAMDPALAMGTSLLIFSGTLQFAALGLLASGAGTLPILVTAIALNARHVVLGAVLRPHIEGSTLKRALMAWFMLDESFGLAVASKRRAGFVLVVGGFVFYLAWQVGTLLGVLGARAVDIQGIAAAIFPVLFVGLAALTARGRADGLRAVVAGVLVALMSLVPPLYPFAAIIAALAVALPGGRRG